MRLQVSPFEIYGWPHWSRLFQALPRSTQRIACTLGVSEAYIATRCSGSRDNKQLSERHARFAAACAVEGLLREKPAWQVAGVWGVADTLTRAGVPVRGPWYLRLCIVSCCLTLHRVRKFADQLPGVDVSGC